MQHRSETGVHLFKVAIHVSDSDFEFETLWAEPAGEGLYRLRNVPFLAYGYSELDVVRAKEVDGQLQVTGIAERSGHSTYRIFFPRNTGEEEFRLLWEPLARLGCTYERANRKLIGIDVPPGADVYAVYEVLEKGEASTLWEFEEGHCGHPLRR